MFQQQRIERVFYTSPEASRSPESWWSRYEGALGGLTSTSRTALEIDCRFVVERGIFERNWPYTVPGSQRKVRTGLVMGSVQSGKTASMLGVTAMALDKGVDIVVVLAGTRISLWRQTYERLIHQLDTGEDGAAKNSRRLLCPSPGVALSGESPDLMVTYRMAPAVVRRKLKLAKPIIVVAMKQTDHLHALSSTLRQNVFPTIRKQGRPVHMLVLDDEADDGSILDAVVEAGQDPIYGRLKQIPRAIANLWDPAEPGPENLFTTYIGYTATPQANLLQEDHNPLAPRDFLISLRTPFDLGLAVNSEDLHAPRSSTFPEPAGLRHFYTGGEMFYRRGAEADLCVPTSNDLQDDLGDAIRAFLVASAVRTIRSKKLGPTSALSTTFPTREAAQATFAEPNCMLFHPSPSIESHFEAAEDILLWGGVSNRSVARSLLNSGQAFLPDELISTLDSDEEKWVSWLERYRKSAIAIETEFNLPKPITLPNWPDVKRQLADEIIKGTRVSVINSDPAADDRPEYIPTLDTSTGAWKPARDLNTIFVSGNVMARGITLEGMTTALFRRVSSSPLADTQMQMQRWFGFRGPHIELCRVFATEEQLQLFRAYHDTDEAIRMAVTESMTNGAPTPSVLEGRNFSATGKIANTGKVPLAPGSKPFVSLVNCADVQDPNAELVASLFSPSPSSSVTVAGTLRGRILDKPLELLDAADLLDRLSYDAYRPGEQGKTAEYWHRIQARVASIRPVSMPFYRPPESGDGDPARKICPYSTAAYFRLWDSCLTRPVPGLFITGSPGELWSMADLETKQVQRPKFWVGIRFGEGPIAKTGAFADLPFDLLTTQKSVSGCQVTTTWGSHNPSGGPRAYNGDEYFDYYHRNEPVPPSTGDSSWRPVGADGLILFYVNQLPGDDHPTVALGISIPAGGPEQFSATRAANA